MALINKKWRKDASANAVGALMRSGGAALTLALLHKLTSSSFTEKSNLNKTIGNVAAPAWSVLAVAGDMFLEHPLLRAFCQGAYAVSVPKSVAVIAPVVGEYFGLSGISQEQMPKILNGVNSGIVNGVPATVRPYTHRLPSASQRAFTNVANYAQNAPKMPSAATTISGIDNSAKAFDAAKSML